MHFFSFANKHMIRSNSHWQFLHLFYILSSTKATTNTQGQGLNFFIKTAVGQIVLVKYNEVFH